MTMTKIPRPEHPRPQFERDDWINLNGTWTYTFDPGKSGEQRGWANSQGFEGEITVPFCPESELSGVGHTDFIEAMWYQRAIDVPEDWDGKKVLLHFGGVDYECEAYIDGQSVGRHWGGTVSFTFDLTPFVAAGQRHNLVVRVRDELRSGNQPGGKQCPDYASRRCHYTRTTGIWQTVWLEAVSAFGLESVQIVPDLAAERFLVTPRFYGLKPGLRWRATANEHFTMVSQAEAPAINGVPRALPMREPRLWELKNPYLYNLTFEVLDGDRVIDTVSSYAGMRQIHVAGNRVYLNGKPIYLRLVLDQGFYPDGIWTAPDDKSLKRDIEYAQVAGFNGARLHQKVFEERFHYWADKLGYLTWGESASWGLDLTEELSARRFLSEWREIVLRDRNHPSIIAWTPFNETRQTGDGVQHNRLQQDAYDLTVALDPTRPVNDASGYVHVKTDLWTVHSYEQDPDALREELALDEDGQPPQRHPEHEATYAGQPYLVDEFGGIQWIPESEQPFADNSWGYGNAPRTLDAFYARLAGQVEAILGNDDICGFCYTQLTDVEQEQNGIYAYDRGVKFDMNVIRSIFQSEK